MLPIIPGKRYGKLVIISEAPHSDKYKKKRMCSCRCDCGNTCEYPIIYLENGIVTSCGCGRHDARRDITGQKFGKLTALEPTGEIRNHSMVWKCVCECGDIVYVAQENLKAGCRTGCGCTKRESELANAKIANKSVPWVDSTNLASISSATVYSNNTSGYKGVYWHSRRKKWIARLTHQGIIYELGAYDTKEEAYQARLDGEVKFFLPTLRANADKYPERLKAFLESHGIDENEE